GSSRIRQSGQVGSRGESATSSALHAEKRCFLLHQDQRAVENRSNRDHCGVRGSQGDGSSRDGIRHQVGEDERGGGGGGAGGSAAGGGAQGAGGGGGQAA